MRITITLSILGLLTVVTCNDLFVGCGNDMGDDGVGSANLAPMDKHACFTSCKAQAYPYYVHDQTNACTCLTYAPPLGFYTSGGPGQCTDHEFSLTRSNYDFAGCFASVGVAPTDTGDFISCMHGCKQHQVAIIQPVGDGPGWGNCTCAGKADLAGLQMSDCGYGQYYAYVHVPQPAA